MVECHGKGEWKKFPPARLTGGELVPSDCAGGWHSRCIFVPNDTDGWTTWADSQRKFEKKSFSGIRFPMRPGWPMEIFSRHFFPIWPPNCTLEGSYGESKEWQRKNPGH
jgi:hypothetical protein